jgi:hypothetical protein
VTDLEEALRRALDDEPSRRPDVRHAFVSARFRRRQLRRRRLAEAAVAGVTCLLAILVASFAVSGPGGADAASILPTAAASPGRLDRSAASSPPDWPVGIETEFGRMCQGERIIRCVWVNYDLVGKRFRAHASIEDAPDAIHYAVKVKDIQLVYRDPVRGDVAVGEPSADNDGWHEEEDIGSSGLVGCDVIRALPDRTVYAQAAFAWQDATGDVEIEVSRPVRLC